MKKVYGMVAIAAVAIGALAVGAWAAGSAAPYTVKESWGTFKLNPKIAAKIKAHQKINYVFSYQASGIALFSQQYAQGYKRGCADGNKIYPMNCSSIAPVQTETAFKRATSSDTVRSRIYSGKPARLLKNRWTAAWEEPGAPKPLPMPLQNLLVSDAHQRLMRSGQPDVVPMPAGQIIGRMNEVRPVADVVASLVAETDQALDRLRNLG